MCGCLLTLRFAHCQKWQNPAFFGGHHGVGQAALARNNVPPSPLWAHHGSTKLTTVALSIYLPFALAKRVSEAAKAASQARSAWVVTGIERLLDGQEDAMTNLATNQICRLLATVEDAIETLPDHERRAAKERIQHRAEHYRQAALRRLGQ